MQCMPFLKLVFILCLSVITSACKWGDVEDPSTFGPWAVGHMNFETTDPARDNRTLMVDLWFPVDAENAPIALEIPGQAEPFIYPKSDYQLLGPFGIKAEIARDKLPYTLSPTQQPTDWDPSSETGQTLIVFSHGYGGTNTQSTHLMETLASHGFIVAAPSHTGNTAQDGSDPFHIALANRVPDISFIIDTMLLRNADPDDPFYNRIYPRSVGVVGHSFGGTTSLGTVTGLASASADPRVKAIAPISAAVENNFSTSQLASIHVPVMLLGGTLDTAVPIENNQLVFDNIVGSKPVYSADIIGANHTHFANVCAIGNWLLDKGFAMDRWDDFGANALIAPYLDTCGDSAYPIEEVKRLQNLYVVSFFKRHLRFQFGYGQYLQSSYAENNEPDVIYSTKNLLEINH